MPERFEDMEIYYILQPGVEKEAGPYSINQLAQMWGMETISEETLFAVQGMDKWLSVATLKGVKPEPPKIEEARGTRCPQCQAILKANAAMCWICGEDFRGAKRDLSDTMRRWDEATTTKAPLGGFQIAKPGTPTWVVAVAAIGCAFGLLMFMGAMGYALASPETKAKMAEDGWKQDAHFTAEKFIKKSFPGAREIGDYRDSVVTREGSTFFVATEVDGLNAFGGPVRKKVVVEMELAGEVWRLKNIVQR